MLGCLWAADSDDSAERLLRAAQQLDPTNVVVVQDLSWLLRGQQRFSEALAVIERALALEEKPAFRARRGLMLMSIATARAVPEDQYDRLWEEAANDLAQAVERDPAVALPVYETAVAMLVDMGDYARGAAILERVLGAMLVQPPNAALTPAELAPMYLRLSELLIRSGQTATGLAYADQAVALPLEPDDRAKVAAARLELRELASRPQ